MSILVYVAGPITDYPVGYIENVRNNVLLGDKVRKLDMVPIIPACDILSLLVGVKLDVDDLQNECIELMLHCDVVLFDRGWASSEGCLKEKRIAEKYNIPIVFSIEELKEFFDY
jgi:hypothetical protein